MKLDTLFFRRGAALKRDPRSQKDPTIAKPARLPALYDPDEIQSTPFDPRARTRVDPRRMSPRQLAAWAHDMYLCRMLAWEEYCLAGFPAELHPHYNRTVGALTGNLAQPDAPRNMVRVWEEKLAFMRRYFDADAVEVRRLEKLLRLLRQLVPANGV